MTKRIETNSMRSVAVFFTFSAMGLTSLSNVSSIDDSVIVPKLMYVDDSYDNMKSDTISIIEFSGYTPTYDQAIEFFGNDVRDFNEKESADYNEALNRIYKPLGMNVLDLC